MAQSSNRITVAGAILYCTGGVVFFITPAFLGAVDRLFKVSPADLGMLSACELRAIACASLLGPLWVNRCDWRVLIRVSALISCAGQIASLIVKSFTLLVVVRTLTGALGEGLLLALSYSLLGQTRNVERSFSLAYAASILISMAALYISPELDRALDTISVLVVIAVLSAAAFFASYLVPSSAITAAAKDQPSRLQPKAWRKVGALALLAQAIWYAGAGGFWVFTEQLAAHNAVPETVIAKAISIGTGAALIGTLVTLGLGSRFGRIWPTVICIGIMAASVFGFMESHQLSGITLELSIFNVCWACGTIYLTAAACAVDEAGTVAVLVPAFQVIGMACGTFVLGHCIDRFGPAIIPLVISGLLAAAVLAIVAFAGAAQRRSTASAV